MSKSASVTISYSISGDGVADSGTKVFTNANAAPRTSATLISGNTNINAPSGFTVTEGVLVIPPANSSVIKIYRGLAGDTGITQQPDNSAWTWLPASTVGNQIVVNANGAEVIELVWV